MARNTDFIPLPGDTPERSFYDSGKLKTEAWMRQGIPANGWSRKTFYESGSPELHECFSHSVEIEQLLYNEAGEIMEHKIYSHTQKQLIDKPVQTSVQKINVVFGTNHIDYFFEHLPAINRFIGADYEEAGLKKAYNDFMAESEEEEGEAADVHWGIEGDEMKFSIWLEKGESYYAWRLWAKDEEGYNKAKAFMVGLG